MAKKVRELAAKFNSLWDETKAWKGGKYRKDFHTRWDKCLKEAGWSRERFNAARKKQIKENRKKTAG
jgi:hypothetical protein